jgi:hypothetical protein
LKSDVGRARISIDVIVTSPAQAARQRTVELERFENMGRKIASPPAARSRVPVAWFVLVGNPSRRRDGSHSAEPRVPHTSVRG